MATEALRVCFRAVFRTPTRRHRRAGEARGRRGTAARRGMRRPRASRPDRAAESRRDASTGAGMPPSTSGATRRNPNAHRDAKKCRRRRRSRREATDARTTRERDARTVSVGRAHLGCLRRLTSNASGAGGKGMCRRPPRAFTIVPMSTPHWRASRAEVFSSNEETAARVDTHQIHLSSSSREVASGPI